MYSRPPINIYSSPLGVSCPANKIAVHKRKDEILDPISECSISVVARHNNAPNFAAQRVSDPQPCLTDSTHWSDNPESQRKGPKTQYPANTQG